MLVKIAEMPAPDRAMAERHQNQRSSPLAEDTSFALKKLTAAEQAKIGALVQKAVS